MKLSVRDQLHQHIQGKRMPVRALIHRLAEAGIRTGMTGWTVLFHKDRQRVAVTVRRYTHDMLKIPAGLPLGPKLPAGPAPKAGESSFHGASNALSVHIG